MGYSTRIERSAARELARLPRRDRERILLALDRLGDNPLAGSPLKGDLRGLRRVRVGDYRAVFEVLDGELVVLCQRTGKKMSVRHLDPSVAGGTQTRLSDSLVRSCGGRRRVAAVVVPDRSRS